MTSARFQFADYSHIREMQVELHSKLLKLQSNKDIVTCARHLGLLHKKEIIFNNEYELSVLADYRVYSYRPHGFNLAELYLRLNRTILTSRYIDLLTRMSVARYLLLRIDEVKEQGVLRVTDIFSEDSFTLVDNGLSQTLNKNDAIAAHFVDLGDYYIQSGAVLPIDYELTRKEEVMRVLVKLTSQYKGETIRITAVDSAKLARATIFTAIRLGYTSSCESVDTP